MPGGNNSLPPLTVIGRTPLAAIDYATPVPSAQVKSAILLAGLRADGRTTVRESVATRDHTERMLRARGVPVRAWRRTGSGGGRGRSKEGWRCRRSTSGSRATSPRPRSGWSPAAIHPDAELTLRDVGVNPTRRARHRPAAADGRRHRGAPDRRPPDDGVGEPLADLVVRSSALRGDRPRPRRRGRAPSTRSPSSAWPPPWPSGTTTIRGAGELRHKESDRIAGIAAGLRALGARIEVDGDDLRIDGGARLRGAATDSLDDHRLAMTFAIAGLVAVGRDHHRAARRRPPSPIPASSTTSKGCEHDEARRPHRPPRGPFAVRRDAAGGLRFARHRRRRTSCGTAPRSSWPTPSPSCATDDFLGANVTIPHKERVVPMVDRLTEEAPRDRRGQHDHARGQAARRAQHRRARASRSRSTRLVGKQKMPRQAVVLGAGGGARAVVYGLITEGFQRVIVFNRHLHRAEGLVKHFGRSASHMELRAMPWHESIIEAELAKTRVLINATSIGLTGDESPVPAEVLHADLLVLDLIYAKTRLLRDAEVGRRDRARRRADAPAPGRRGVHALDRPEGAAGADAGSALPRRAPAASARPRASQPGRRSRRANPPHPPSPTDGVVDHVSRA